MHRHVRRSRAWRSARCTSARRSVLEGGPRIGGRDRSRRSTWFLAEGATGPFFETFILLANPQTTSDAEVTLTFLRASGVPITKTKTVRAAGRVDGRIIEFEDPALANTAFGTQVTSTRADRRRARAILAVRAGSVVRGAQQLRRDVARHEDGASPKGASAARTTIRRLHPAGESRHARTANVTITFLRSNGSTGDEDVHRRIPCSRFNVSPGPGGLVAGAVERGSRR